MHQCLSQKQPPPPEVPLLTPFLSRVLAVNTRLLLEQCRSLQQIATNTFNAGVSWRLEGGRCFILVVLIPWHSTSLDWPEGSLLSSQGALSPLHLWKNVHLLPGHRMTENRAGRVTCSIPNSKAWSSHSMTSLFQLVWKIQASPLCFNIFRVKTFPMHTAREIQVRQVSCTSCQIHQRA